MALRLPGEIVIEEVLPTLRVELARALDRRSFTQQEIADCLGVTQAAVSKYLRDDAAMEPLIAEDDRVAATVQRIADGFDTGEMDEYKAMAELLALIEALEDRGPICELHEAAMPALEGMGCDLCVRGIHSSLTRQPTAIC